MKTKQSKTKTRTAAGRTASLRSAMSAIRWQKWPAIRVRTAA